MDKKDLRKNILPAKLNNTDENYNFGNKNFQTEDLIYIETSNDLEENNILGVSPTDYAKMNGIHTNLGYKSIDGSIETSPVWLRSNREIFYSDTLHTDASIGQEKISSLYVGICPSLHYKLPQIGEKIDIKEVKNISENKIYHTLQLGEYPKTRVNEELNLYLECLYNNGKIMEGLVPTGRWFSGNGQKEELQYAGKHSPEFIYEGKKYARVLSNKTNMYDNIIEGVDNVEWTLIEPISFIIKNWDDMPTNINKNGTGRAEYFDLRSEYAINAGIPFYSNSSDGYGNLWQNSTIRGFLNGINVENIKENGNTNFTERLGGDFSGKCNFLNEAFNKDREPILEYEIPRAEKNIPNDAFNGCVCLKKLIIHPYVNSIGNRALEGVKFKYIYINKNEALVLDQILPENIEEYTNSIEVDLAKKVLIGFEYDILFDNNKDLSQVSKLVDVLDKNNFAIPYGYAKELVEKKQVDILCNNTDFRYFKSEFPNINKDLSFFPKKERIAFFKFASALGCFSKEKLRNKDGKETTAFIGQKASSFLAMLLKTKEITLRIL